MPAVPSAALGGPQDQPWKRYVDDELAALVRAAERQNTDGIAGDKGLAASVAGLARSLAAYREQQEQILEAQAGIVANAQALADQVAFLQNASITDTRTTATSASPGASSGISLSSFDGSYDCSVSLTSSSTGRLLVTVGGQLTGSEGVSALVGYEVVIDGSVAVSVDWQRAAAAGGGLATTSRTSLIAVPANTPVEVRTRRGWTGASGGVCVWGYQSLIVTKEGL
jgi:hypothetical protein